MARTKQTDGRHISQLAEVWSQVGDRLSAAERAQAQRVIETLREWHAPEVACEAALAAPLLESRAAGAPFPTGVFGPEAVSLAERFVGWRASFADGQKKAGVETNSGWLSLALGELYRLAYLDVPSFPFMLLLLADHDVSMSAEGAMSREAALQTLRVFAPLAEMLGIWNLYRGWAERSYAHLFPEQYSEMSAMLGSPEEYDEKRFEEMVRAKSQVPAAHEAKRAKGGPGRHYLMGKAEAFLRLRPALLRSLDEMGVEARVIPISHHAGLALRRVHDGEATDDVARRLSIRVVCRSVPDCYTVLGVIHNLGSPVSVGSTLHFKDHIASPQPNGYRALHTAITFRDFRQGGGSSIVVECRVVTEHMHQLNQYGVIATQSGELPGEMPSSAWWHRLPELDRQLAKTSAGGGGIEEYLGRHEPRSSSDPLYVFTPRGEIVLLPSDSTSLDFAYSIHTQVGHHAMKIEVNGKPMPLGYPLRNADIVRVHHHPNFAGPDISWLGLVKTSWARKTIRRGLRWRASSAHVGRAYFEGALLKELNRYEKDRGYKLAVSSERVNDFLLESARAAGYTEITAFYAKINGDNEATRRLVERLVSTEIASGMVNSQGRPLTSVYDPARISVCMTCRPAPGDPIVGVEGPSQAAGRQLTVHEAGKPHAAEAAGGAAPVQLDWAKPATFDTSDLLVFRLKGIDRPGLLRDVLEAVRLSRVELLKVDAETSGDGQAGITLLLRGEWLGGFDKVSERLSKISDFDHIQPSSPSPSQRIALSASPAYVPVPPPPVPNPYTAEEVYERGIFFNRERPLNEILQWLSEPPPRKVMILHGQRRVGKTSLVKYLMREYLSQYRLAHPVFVDFQGLNAYSSAEVASIIVRRVFESLRQPTPPREQDEPPWVWADRALGQALKLHQRLLVIIDEFNFLIDAEANGTLDSAVYDNLRFLMNEQRDVNWLLVVQDTHFHDPELWRGASVLFQKNRTLAVHHLDRDNANLLAVEPARKCGVKLRPRDKARILNRMMRLTAGSPFLIQLLCHEIVEKATRDKLSYVEEKHLDEAAALLLHIGQRHFAHFKKNLVGIREVVMAAVATALKNRKSAPEEKVRRMLREAAPEIRPEAVDKSLAALRAEGLISFKCWGEGGARRITVPIELFRRFIARDPDLPGAAEKWRASRPAAARAK